MSGYNTVITSHTKALIVKKSEFIAHIQGIHDDKEASDLLEGIQKEHYKASHHCYAYILGDRSERKKFTDDNEPSGTAGKPILGVLEQADLTYVIAVITRYFGGIKLGASGLSRAYAQSAANCLSEASIVRKEECVELICKCDYGAFGKIQTYLKDNNFMLNNTSFYQTAEISAFVPIDSYESVEKKLTDITSGKCEITKGKKEFIIV